MIVDNGFKIAVNRIAKDIPDYSIIEKIKVGMNQSSVSSTDTDLTKPVPILNTEQVYDGESITNWNATTDGSVSLNSTSYKTLSNSLNLIKSGTTVDNVTYYNEALAARDFTDKDLWGWVYIKDSITLDKITSIEVRYGNDYNINYYKYVYNNSDLTVGWNVINFNSTTATEVGTVTLTSMDSLVILITFNASTDTLAAGDVMIDDYKLASKDDYYTIFTNGYPVIDETNMEITIESTVNSTQANGYLLNGIGTFNTDSSPLMQDVFKFTDLSKSNSEEIIFEIKNRLTRR